MLFPRSIGFHLLLPLLLNLFRALRPLPWQGFALGQRDGGRGSRIGETKVGLLMDEISAVGLALGKHEYYAFRITLWSGEKGLSLN